MFFGRSPTKAALSATTLEYWTQKDLAEKLWLWSRDLQLVPLDFGINHFRQLLPEQRLATTTTDAILCLPATTGWKSQAALQTARGAMGGPASASAALKWTQERHGIESVGYAFYAYDVHVAREITLDDAWAATRVLHAAFGSHVPARAFPFLLKAGSMVLI